MAHQGEIGRGADTSGTPFQGLSGWSERRCHRQDAFLT